MNSGVTRSPNAHSFSGLLCKLRRWLDEIFLPTIRAYLPSDFLLRPGPSFWWALSVSLFFLVIVYGRHTILRREQLKGWTTYTVETGLPDNVVRTLEVSSDGAVWLGTDKGVGRVVGDSFTVVPSPGASTLRVMDLSSDASGILWVGTTQGLYSLSRDGEWTTTPVTGSVLSLDIDAHGALWVAGEQLWRGYQGQWQTSDLVTPSGIALRRPLVLAVQGQSLWVGGTAGLGQLDLQSGTWNPVEFSVAGECMLGVRAIYPGPEGDVWVGTGGHGLCHYTGAEWVRFHTGNSDIPWSVVSAIAQDDEGRIWVATEEPASDAGAVAVFDGQSWETLTPRNSGLVHGRVYDLIVNGPRLWFATRAGLSVWSTVAGGLPAR